MCSRYFLTRTSWFVNEREREGKREREREREREVERKKVIFEDLVVLTKL